MKKISKRSVKQGFRMKRLLNIGVGCLVYSLVVNKLDNEYAVYMALIASVTAYFLSLSLVFLSSLAASVSLVVFAPKMDLLSKNTSYMICFLIVLVGTIYPVQKVVKSFLSKMKRNKSYTTPAGDFYNSRDWRRLRMKVFEKYGDNVACFVPGCNEKATDVDHIKPRSKFPELALDEDNMQLLCSGCNRAKSNDIIADFRSFAS